MFDYKGLSLEELRKRFNLYKSVFAFYDDCYDFSFTLDGTVIYESVSFTVAHDCICTYLVSDTFYKDIERDSAIIKENERKAHEKKARERKPIPRHLLGGGESLLIYDITSKLDNDKKFVSVTHRYGDCFNASIVCKLTDNSINSKIYKYTEIEEFKQWLKDNYEK